MKKLLILLSLIATNALATELTVTVKNFPDKTGVLHVAVCDKKNFKTDDYEKDCVATFKEEIAGRKEITFTLSDIPEKALAIQGFIDKNANGKLDTNFFGIPKETVLFVRSFTGFPSFDDVKTNVSGPTLNVVLKAQ